MYSLSALCLLLAPLAAVVCGKALDSRTTCYSGVFTIISRGSEEPQGQSILEPIAGAVGAAIPNSGSNEVVYPALLSFWNSVPTGVNNLQQQMQDYYSSCPNGKIVLMGYSQGSYVVATALAGGNFSGQTFTPTASNIGNNIAAVVLFGNPSRLPGQGTVAEGTNCATACTDTSPLALTSAYGSNMQVYAGRTEEWCDDNDPICCKSGNNIQAHLSYWSDNTTDTVVQFVTSQLGSSANSSSTLPSGAASSASSAASSIISSVTASAASLIPSSAASSAVSQASSAILAVSSEVLSIASLAAVSTASGPAATAASTSAPASSAASPSAAASSAPASSDGHSTTMSAATSTWVLSVCSVFLLMGYLA